MHLKEVIITISRVRREAANSNRVGVALVAAVELVSQETRECPEMMEYQVGAECFDYYSES